MLAFMDIRRTFGLNVAKERKKKGCSQEQLAFDCGLHRTYISGIERGIRNPTLVIVEKIAKALGIKPGALLD